MYPASPTQLFLALLPLVVVNTLLMIVLRRLLTRLIEVAEKRNTNAPDEPPG